MKKYKLKLRVYDIFYNLIHKYDPEVPNFNHRPFYCVTDGDHIYTLNTDLDNLAQKSEDDDYKISVGSNFHIPDKQSKEVQPHNHRAHRRDAGYIERSARQRRGGVQGTIHGP